MMKHRIVNDKFTNVCKNLSMRLGHGNRPSGRMSYPYSWSLDTGRIKKTDTIHSWYSRIVESVFEEDIAAFSIEENIAIFLIVKWRSNSSEDESVRELFPDKYIHYCNFQSLVVLDGDLFSYYLGEAKLAQYFRLDFDLDCLGPMLKEALPHVHTVPHEEPRLSMPIVETGNVLIDFIEFIYLNYHYNEWKEWATLSWQHHRDYLRIPEAQDPFTRIMRAYDMADYTTILSHRDRFQEMKNCWRSVKDDFYELRIPVSVSNFLSYSVRSI